MSEPRKYEIALWPSYFGKHVLIRMISGFVKGLVLLSAITGVFLVLAFVTRLGVFIWLARGFMVAILITPFLPIVSYFQRNRKEPSLGINQEGFLLNERGWNAAFFTWDEIASVSFYEHPKYGEELHFEFVSYTQALNKPGQDKFIGSLKREYEMEKQPFKISGQLVKGDIKSFIDLFLKYFEKYKAEYPVSKLEAFRMARVYVEEYSLPFVLDRKKMDEKRGLEGLSGPIYLFEDQKTKGHWIVVSQKNKSVEGIYSSNGWLKPHELEILVWQEDAKAIVRRHSESDLTIERVILYPNGIDEYPHPCWAVQAKNERSTMDGTSAVDFFIDVQSGKIGAELWS